MRKSLVDLVKMGMGPKLRERQEAGEGKRK